MHTRFTTDAARLFTEEERDTIVDRLAADPRIGVVIPASESIRKIRFGFGGRGKRGGARVIYIFGGDDVPVVLLAAFAKNERDDLSKMELTAMGRAARAILERYRRRR